MFLPIAAFYHQVTESLTEVRVIGTTNIRAEIIEKRAWWCGNANDNTQEVAMLLPNGFGLFDMHGHLQEWTADKGGCGDADPDNPNAGSYFPASEVDPFCPTGQHTYRIFRGGMFYGLTETLAAGYRSMNAAEYRENHVGVRLFLTHQEDIFVITPK